MERWDFFISYTAADRAWAEWIAWQLEHSGFSTRLQAWDFRPGSAFPQEMHEALQRAERTVAVLSQAYLGSKFAASEWLAVFRDDPTGAERKLIPIRVEPCKPAGLLGSITWIDLVGTHEQEAIARLLAGIRRERAKPASAPGFPPPRPNKGATNKVTEPPRFPSASSTDAATTSSTNGGHPQMYDSVEASWAAMTIGQALWIAEAHGSAMRFRRFGEHAHSRASDMGGPVSDIAMAEDGTAVAAQVGDGVRLAGIDVRGRLSAWSACVVDKESPAHLVAVRAGGGNGTPEVLMTNKETTFSLTSRSVGLARRREVCASPARCAAPLGGAFLIISPAGRVVRGTAPSAARDGWLDVDAGTGAGVELLAGIRQEHGDRRLLVVRRDTRSSDIRSLTIPNRAERVRVARTPTRREPPAQVVLEVGSGELVTWGWEELATETSQP